MNRTLAVAAASTLFILSTPVLANNLNGFFVGADATIAESYDFDTTTLKQTSDEDVGDVEGISISDSFGSFDVKAGYNFDLDSKLFVGLEANYNLSGIDEVFESTSTDTNSFAKEDSYGIRAKIGRLVSDDTALYGILGYQITDFELTTVDTDTDVYTNDHGGITYGVGATYSVAPKVLITAEAVRTDYSSEKYIQEFYDIDPNETKFNVGIAYRFDI